MKGANWFKHDSNARNDRRISELRMDLGMEGYGIYMGIIEILCEQSDYKIQTKNVKSIAWEFRVEEDVIIKILSDYDLFRRDGDFIYSSSLLRRMTKLNDKKERLSEAGRKGGLSSAKARLNHIDKNRIDKNIIDKNKKNNKKSIKERCVEFDLKVREYVKKTPHKYAPKLVDAFISHWSQYGIGDKKMLFEEQSKFGIGHRIGTFVKNDYDGFQKEYKEERLKKKQQMERQREYNLPESEYATEEEKKQLLTRFKTIGEGMKING